MDFLTGYKYNPSDEKIKTTETDLVKNLEEKDKINKKLTPLQVQENNKKLENQKLKEINEFLGNLDEEKYSEQCITKPYILLEKENAKLCLWYYRNYLPIWDKVLEFWIYKWYGKSDDVDEKIDINDPKRYFKILNFNDQLKRLNDCANKIIYEEFDIKDMDVNQLKELIEKSVSDRKREESWEKEVK